MNAIFPGLEGDDLDTVRAGLRADAESVARALLGEPNRKLSNRRELRWGRKGGLAMARSGAKRGACFDHEAGEGGDLLWLIGRETGAGFPEALSWARDFLGLPEPLSRPATGAERAAKEARRRALAEKREKQRAQREAEQAAEETDRVSRAKRLAAEAEPAGDTPADAYLAKWRGIPRPTGGWPTAVRYHRGRHALLVVATDDAGEVRAVQLVHLAADARKLTTEEAQARGLPGAKQTFGVMAGAAVRLPGAPGALLLAEGPETGLSVWAASGMETWIALGGIGKMTPPAGRTAVVCADDDKRHSNVHRRRRDAVRAWRKAGVEPHTAWPWAVRRFDGSDFNDALRAEGAAAVQVRVAAALPQRDGPDARLAVEIARTELEKCVGAFFEAAKGFDADDPEAPPPVVHAIRADVGVGKSAKTREAILRKVLDMRARGDTRKVAILIPTHDLGDEQAKAFETMPEFVFAGLKVRVWRGRKAPDPEHADFNDREIPKAEKTAMCRDLDAVADVERLGLPIEKHVCRSKKGECPFFNECGYQRQKEADADVWIGPHELLFNEKPESMGKLAAVVVDEAAWQDGLEGVGGPPVELPLDTFDPNTAVPGDADGKRTARLRELLRRLRAGLDAHGDGELRAGPMFDAGLDAETAREGKSLAYDCIVDPGIVPGMRAAERRALAKAAAGNRTALRIAGVFDKVQTLLSDHPLDASGWLELRHKDTAEGRVRVLRMRGRRKVCKGWLVPTLLIDALLDERLVKPFWPRVRVTGRISALTPHARFRQVTSRDFAQSALVPDDEHQGEEENKRRLRLSRKVRAAVFREARRTAGRVLVVTQQKVRQHWEELGCVPANVEFAHFNAIAGHDEWGPQRDRDGNVTDPGVALVVLVGRTLPSAAAAEDMARALTGLGIGDLAGDYQRAVARHRLADGRTIATETDRHPHQIVEAIRWQCCEGQLIQALGRARPANRTEANPVDVLLLTDRPLPFPVDETVSWEELGPDWCDSMMAAGGVALENAADAAKAFGGSRFAAWRKSDRDSDRDNDCFAHAKLLRSPCKGFLSGEAQQLRRCVTFTYQIRGRGQAPRAGLVDLALVPDPEAWLEARLGPVKWCTVDEPGPEPDPPAPPSPPSEELEEEREDVPEPEALDLPLAVVSAPPPALLHRIAERAGGRAPPRVLVLELVSEAVGLDGLGEAPATAVRILAADRTAVAAPDG